MFKKVLVANRGEIAVRIINALRELGIQSLSVYSEPDKKSLAVSLSDEACSIGSADLRDSYLNMDKIIRVAKENSCEAIHPGYGFLSENSVFAQKCIDAGIVFIGSSPESIKLMGDKIRSREIVRGLGVPLVESTRISKNMENTVENIIEMSKHIEYPVIVKASAGGGGKGMKIVNHPKELPETIVGAKREAKAYFGDDTVYIEKYVVNPRHIEFQVLGDKHGNYMHFFERECSIQRRHQKVIEETPSTALTPEIRNKMGQAAIKIISNIKYSNAGTIEFLVDEKLNYYFLEMNTRIQVEHPITEMVTGVDLVKQQIRIAAGEKMTYMQKDVFQRGHAIECRIYAESSERDFMPSPGKIFNLREPQGSGIRNDKGIRANDEITTLYDPMISKLIVHGENREDARMKMIRALKDYVVQGVDTGIPFLIKVLEQKDFIEGKTFTSFLDRNKKEIMEKLKVKTCPDHIALLASMLYLSRNKAASKGESGSRTRYSTWESVGPWRN